MKQKTILLEHKTTQSNLQIQGNHCQNTNDTSFRNKNTLLKIYIESQGTPKQPKINLEKKAKSSALSLSKGEELKSTTGSGRLLLQTQKIQGNLET